MPVTRILIVRPEHGPERRYRTLRHCLYEAGAEGGASIWTLTEVSVDGAVITRSYDLLVDAGGHVHSGAKAFLSAVDRTTLEAWEAGRRSRGEG